eukprot:m.149692 g.149692  ORF g.149692 m.149692 type:complete len:509 (+) comp11673_c0_seq3:82-1608(+)
MTLRYLSLLLGWALVTIGRGAMRVVDPAQQTLLDKYVAKPDSNFQWTELSNATFKGLGYTAHVLNMTSQRWLTRDDFVADVDRSLWWHYFVVIVSEHLDSHTNAMMYMTGGHNSDPPPSNPLDEETAMIGIVAVESKAVACILYQIPNQPIYFAEETPTPQGRSEDAMIAWTWHHFHDNPSNTSAEWLARLPMTKAGVRAMDAVEAYVAKTLSRQITGWAVAGASKRGWTTWTVAAVDDRVVAFAPLVLDALNLSANLHHMYQAYGGWTFALKDYYKLNFTAEIDDPGTLAMWPIVDAFSYFDRYETIPKFMINACGDEFLQMDDDHYWWDALKGEKHRLIIQDAEHSLATGLEQVVPSLASFITAVFHNTTRPTITWELGTTPTGNNITVHAPFPPEHVRVWHADTLQSERRDWRLLNGQDPCPTKVVDGACFAPVFWHESKPTQLSPTSWVAAFDAPPTGWRAYNIEVQFPGPGLFPFKYNTQVQIVPETFPYPKCYGNACKGALL